MPNEQQPRLAFLGESSNPNYKIVLVEVGNPAGSPDKLMVFTDNPGENVFWLKYDNIEGFIDLKERIEHALSKPIMHREEFDVIFEAKINTPPFPKDRVYK